MTIIPINVLSPLELERLGNNLDGALRGDNFRGENFRGDIDAMNRSLATLGEELDDEAIGAACRSEHVAG